MCDSYKAIGASKVDKNGTPDNCEFWGLSKDGIMNQSAPQDAPDVVREYQTALRPFVERSHAVCMIILTCLEKSLNIPPRTLEALHSLTDPSTDQLRLLRMPPKPGSGGVSLLPHTDFGSITFLWNKLVGLQVCNKGEWQFVRPEPGCAIVNVGDSLAILTGKRICSG